MLSFVASSREASCADFSLPFDRPYDPNQELLFGDGLGGTLRSEDDGAGAGAGNGISRDSTGASTATSDVALAGTSAVSPSHWPARSKSGADTVSSWTGCDGKDSADGLGWDPVGLVLYRFIDPPLIDCVSFLSSRTVEVESSRSRFRIIWLSFEYKAAGGSLVAADSSGVPCSGSAKTRETLAGAVFFEKDLDLQADGEAAPVGRRPWFISRRNVETGAGVEVDAQHNDEKA